MKITEKTVIVVFLLMMGLFTACNHGNDQSSQNNLSVSTNEVILQSIEKLENMVTPTTSVNSEAVFSYIAPNVTFEYEEEKKNLFEGVELAKEFSKYLGTQQDVLDNIIYHDSLSELEEYSYKDAFCKKWLKDDYVCVSVKVDYDEGDWASSECFHSYFEYDYTKKEPTRTSVVDIRVNDSEKYDSIIVAQFDYVLDTIYGYKFTLSPNHEDTIMEALNQENFDFEKFKNSQLSDYEFVKLDISEQNIEGYGYSKSSDSTSVDGETEMEKFKELYTSIYDRIKSHIKNVNPWANSTVVEKTYFLEILNKVLG